MAVLVEEALASRALLVIPAGVLAQAWREGAGQARIARLLRTSVTTVIALDQWRVIPAISRPSSRR